MNDVVERVARRLAEENGFAWENCAQDQWRSDARAAIIETIKSLREPTEAMNEAAKPFRKGVGETAGRIWGAMINAALADASPDIGKEGIGNDDR